MKILSVEFMEAQRVGTGERSESMRSREPQHGRPGVSIRFDEEYGAFVLTEVLPPGYGRDPAPPTWVPFGRVRCFVPDVPEARPTKLEAKR